MQDISTYRAARALGGFAEDARVIESTKAHLFLATELAAKVESQGRELKTMRELLRCRMDARQLELLGINAPRVRPSGYARSWTRHRREKIRVCTYGKGLCSLKYAL